jgi:transposase
MRLPWDNNFTLNRPDGLIKPPDEHIPLFVEEPDSCGQEESRKLSGEELQHKYTVCKERKGRYGRCRNTLEESGEKQISLTDPDAKRMKAGGGFCAGCHVQAAVDADSHMTAGFRVTGSPADHGRITGVATDVEKDCGVALPETVADKGYECPENHADTLASGIIPNVIRRDGGCTEQVEFDRMENTVTDEQKASTGPGEGLTKKSVFLKNILSTGSVNRVKFAF